MASTYVRVRVAMPLMCCNRLRITRSQLSSTRALWRITASTCPEWTRTPSNISGWLMTSKRVLEEGRGSMRANISRKRGTEPSPATTSSCRAIIDAEARKSGSMVRLVVASLAALSSTSACSSNVSIRPLFQSIYLVLCVPPNTGAPGLDFETWETDQSIPNEPSPTDCHRSEEHTSELQSLRHLVCRLL